MNKYQFAYVFSIIFTEFVIWGIDVLLAGAMVYLYTNQIIPLPSILLGSILYLFFTTLHSGWQIHVNSWSELGNGKPIPKEK